MEDPLFVEQADQEAIDFVKHIKADKTWVLALQVVMLNNQEEENSKYTLITLRNIGDAIEIKDPIIKEDWIISL